MTGNHSGGSAKIYAFPKGGRAGLVPVQAGSLETEARRPLVCTDSWYHEAAIRAEREGPRKQ